MKACENIPCPQPHTFHSLHGSPLSTSAGFHFILQQTCASLRHRRCFSFPKHLLFPSPSSLHHHFLFTLWSSCCFPNCSLLIFSTLNFLFFWSCTSPNWIPCAESWQQLLGRPPYQKHQKAVRLSQCNRGSVKHLHYPSGTARGKKINTCLKKNKHKNSLRRQSASIVQRKYSYNHSRRQGKYPHLEKVVFHCIVCTQSHLCLWWDFCVFPEQLRVRTYSAGISRSSAETRVSKLARASTKKYPKTWSRQQTAWACDLLAW